MNDAEKIREWIRWKEKKEGRSYTFKELSADSGLSQTFLSQVMNGHKTLGTKSITKLSEAFGVTVPRFLSGPPNEGRAEEKKDDYVYIPFEGQPRHPIGGGPVYVAHYHARFGAGNGSNHVTERPRELLPFSSEWVHKVLHANPNELVMVDVAGDSMEPTLLDGDTVLVDTSRRDLEDNRIYVFRTGDDLFVKRVQKQFGRVLIKSDNPLYESFYFDEATGEVFGMVVWRAGTIGKL